LEVELTLKERQLLEERKQMLQINAALKREIERLQAAVRKAGLVNLDALEGRAGNLVGFSRGDFHMDLPK
jgi:chromosome segregation ATPase